MKSWSFFSNVQTNEEAKKTPKNTRHGLIHQVLMCICLEGSPLLEILFWECKLIQISIVFQLEKLKVEENSQMSNWIFPWWLNKNDYCLAGKVLGCFSSTIKHTHVSRLTESCLFDIVAFWITIYLWFYKIIFKNFTSLNDCKIYL